MTTEKTLLCYEDREMQFKVLESFFVLITFGFAPLVRQNKQFQDISLGFWTFFTIVWDFIDFNYSI